MASWSSIDYFGRWKALHYHARRFFAPLLVSVSREGELLRVFVVSDRRSSSAARLTLRMLDFSGDVSYQRQLELAVAANASQPCFEAPVTELLNGRDPRGVVFVAELQEGQALASRGLYYFVKSKELALPDPELQLEQRSTREGHGVLRLHARRLARAVWLSAEPSAEPFAAQRFSDNFFDLLPGETRELAYRGPAPARVALRSLRDSYVEPG